MVDALLNFALLDKIILWNLLFNQDKYDSM